MDPVRELERKVKDLSLKIEAILQALELDCEYTPESYTLVKPSEGGNS